MIIDDKAVANIKTVITNTYESSSPGIPKIVASVLGTRTAVAATVNQTISLVN